MKLSEDTIDILQNFQNINPSIVFQPGKVIRVLSPAGSIFARAEVEEEFPVGFGIYDISKFLALLSISDESEIEFHDNYMMIKQENSQIRYSYCNPSLISTKSTDPKNVKADVEFELKPEKLNSVIKAMSIFGFSHLMIVGDGSTISIQTRATKDQSSNFYKLEIGETDKVFESVLEADRLKLLPETYTVSVIFDGPIFFSSEKCMYMFATQRKKNRTTD